MLKTIARYFRKGPKELKDFPKICGKVNGTEPNGPNCWNATQLILGKKRKQQYVSPEEMIAWLKLNTKRVKVKKAETKMILVMWRKKTLIHTAVYINDEGLMWHKAGYAGRYEIATEKEVKARYKPHGVTKFEIRVLTK